MFRLLSFEGLTKYLNEKLILQKYLNQCPSVYLILSSSSKLKHEARQISLEIPFYIKIGSSARVQHVAHHAVKKKRE